MKLAISLVLFVCGLFVFAATAQTVKVAHKKTAYRRPKPSADFKRTFTVTRPVVTASSPALSRKITSLVSPEKVLGLNLKEEMGEYQWLENADFEIVYNAHGILCLREWMEGTAAYPDGVTRYVSVDTEKGMVLTPEMIFTDPDGLAAKVRRMQKEEIRKASEEIRKDPETADTDPASLFAEAAFTAAELKSFSVEADGVTFHYDYGFPHVLTAIQPDGEFKLNWRELRPFIRRDGLLARLVS